MRTLPLSRQTRSILKTHPPYHRAFLSSSHVPRYPRTESPVRPPSATPRLSKRSSSSVTPTSGESEPPEPPVPNPSSSDPPPEDSDDKPKRRTRTSTTRDTELSAAQLPGGLDILWIPQTDPEKVSTGSTSLPPPEVLDELLHHLHITLHPQTQHRAAYATPSSSLVEPTFALYCPIEGGDHYIDETIRELARKVGAEVLVIDAVQLAAGESGHFGKAASVLQLPNNPLHFSPSPTSTPWTQGRPASYAEEDEDDGPHFIPTQHMTLHVLAPVSSRTRGVLAPARSSPAAKLKNFFDDLVSISAEVKPSEQSEESAVPSPSASPLRRPRIVYVRDFPTLAASSAQWYPALLAAVRQRRQGPISRASSPVMNPMTIVFGITPPFIAPSSPPSPSGSNQGLLSLLTSRAASASSARLSNPPSRHEYTEDSAGDKARERRMLDRLKRWVKGGASSQDVPQLSLSTEEADELNSSKSRGRNVVVVGGSDGMSGLPAMLGSALSGGASRMSTGSSDSEESTQFFRTSVVMPAVRSLPQEKATRMARRREINELVLRMGVAAVGGELPRWEREWDVAVSTEGERIAESEHELAMWEEWGRTVQTWPTVRRIADRAVGGVLAAQGSRASTKVSLEPTTVSWSVVSDAWALAKSSQDLWKLLLQDASGKVIREVEEEDAVKEPEEPPVDEVIERVKRDPDLEQHEVRLLGCIVDSNSLTTTFEQVHLPPHTIDSVRTIVSLPLLYPDAFQHGILKQHSMTGCLLFGPPGTGKTLVVRALAKEAGCRMLAISPSDVMDMYVGEGEKLVRSVFSLARRLSPCVVFIDELDALFGARVSRETGGGIAHRGVITEFMQEMDGLKSSKDDNVIVIGATNRPFDLDDAVLRRLPRRLLVDLPGAKEREAILKIHLRDEQLDPDVDLEGLAKKTETFSGSDLKHLCVSAALDAVKEHVEVPWRQGPQSVSSQQQPTPAVQAPTLKDADHDISQAAAPPAASSETSSAEASGKASPIVAIAEHEVAPQPAEAAVEPSADADATAVEAKEPATPIRILRACNFQQALKEITPSSSESLGSLSELRKWNDEFGEGRKERRKQFWGKGRFGFTIETTDSEVQIDKVSAQPSPSLDSSSTR